MQQVKQSFNKSYLVLGFFLFCFLCGFSLGGSGMCSGEAIGSNNNCGTSLALLSAELFAKGIALCTDVMTYMRKQRVLN